SMAGLTRLDLSCAFPRGAKHRTVSVRISTRYFIKAPSHPEERFDSQTLAYQFCTNAVTPSRPFCARVRPCKIEISRGIIGSRMSSDDRYSRQILFEGIGQEGQTRLSQSKVVIIGCGALGAIQAETLSRAGVGHLILVDRDFVEESNLQRQIMFEESDALDRLPKAVAAASRIARVNSDIQVEPIVTDVNFENIEEIIAGANVVLDGTDNFETRFLINDACLKSTIPW